jgi:hypothetical protein
MAIELTNRATEESTYVIVATFKNEDGDLVTPKTVTWTLTDSDGDVINNRQDVSITPGTSVNIVLTGADLQATGTVKLQKRVVTVKAVYDSILGNDLALVEAGEFDLENLKGI